MWFDFHSLSVFQTWQFLQWLSFGKSIVLPFFYNQNFIHWSFLFLYENVRKYFISWWMRRKEIFLACRLALSPVQMFDWKFRVIPSLPIGSVPTKFDLHFCLNLIFVKKAPFTFLRRWAIKVRRLGASFKGPGHMLPELKVVAKLLLLVPCMQCNPTTLPIFFKPISDKKMSRGWMFFLSSNVFILNKQPCCFVPKIRLNACHNSETRRRPFWECLF